jgi:hypothetical protein
MEREIFPEMERPQRGVLEGKSRTQCLRKQPAYKCENIFGSDITNGEYPGEGGEARMYARVIVSKKLLGC